MARDVMLEPLGPDATIFYDFWLPFRSLGPVLLAEEMVGNADDRTFTLLIMVLSAGVYRCKRQCFIRRSF
jgi:hypothetical protein